MPEHDRLNPSGRYQDLQLGARAFLTGQFPTSVAAADVSGDGKPDIIVVNERANTVGVLLGNGDGTLQARVDYPTGDAPGPERDVSETGGDR